MGTQIIYKVDKHREKATKSKQKRSWNRQKKYCDRRNYLLEFVMLSNVTCEERRLGEVGFTECTKTGYWERRQ